MAGLDRLTWLVLALAVLAALALRSVWKSRVHAKRVKIIWSAVVLIPLLGPVGWFILGRDRRRR
jgi:phospholipase D-like protein